MYLVTTYGNWNYECFVYDLDSVPDYNWQMAVAAIVDSGEDIHGVYKDWDKLEPRKPDQRLIWKELRWQIDESYEERRIPDPSV